MRALVAPDKFKGTLSAAEVAASIVAGLGDRADVDLCPIADGGEGTAEVLLEAGGGEWVGADAHDALGAPVECRFALIGEDRETAVVEVAEASGLWRLDPELLDPLGASSLGTGELIAAAIAAGARDVLVACGGSATTDAGLGALEAIDPRSASIACLCDTDVPFLVAASAYGPQKGADREQVAELERRLTRIAAELPHDPRRLPWTGAAGGLAGGFWAHGAKLVGGAAHVLTALDFDRRLAGADLVFTGEGRLDPTSLRGKGVGEIVRRAARVAVPCHVIVGADEIGSGSGGAFASVREAGTPGEIESAVAEIALDPGLPAARPRRSPD